MATPTFFTAKGKPLSYKVGRRQAKLSHPYGCTLKEGKTGGGTVYSIDRNGLKSVLHDWTDKENPDLEVIEDDKINYLRFEYEMEGHPEWLHIENEDSWY